MPSRTHCLINGDDEALPCPSHQVGNENHLIHRNTGSPPTIDATEIPQPRCRTDTNNSETISEPHEQPSKNNDNNMHQKQSSNDPNSMVHNLDNMSLRRDGERTQQKPGCCPATKPSKMVIDENQVTSSTEIDGTLEQDGQIIMHHCDEQVTFKFTNPGNPESYSHQFHRNHNC